VIWPESILMCIKAIRTTAVVLIAFFVLFNDTQAQLIGRYDDDINRSSFPYHIMTYGTQHGLPVNQVEGLAKDPRTGVLVLATSNGLHQYNGYEFRPYRDDPFYNVTIFQKLYTSHLYENLLGVNAIGELYHIAQQAQLIDTVGAADISPSHFLTINRNGRVRYADRNSRSPKIYETGVKGATFIHRWSADTLIIADQTKTYRYLKSRSNLEVWLEEPIIGIEKSDGSDTVILLSKQKVYEYKENQLRRKNISLPPNQEFITLSKHNNAYLISSSAGLFYLFGDFIFKYSEEDILPSNVIRTILVDLSNETLFMGTVNKGLMKLSPKKVVNLFTQTKDFLGSYGSVVYDPEGVYTFAGRNIVKVKSQDSYELLNMNFASEYAASLSIYGDTLFVGTWGNGVFALSKKDGTLLYHQVLNRDVVFATYRDPDGLYWLGTSNGLYHGRSVKSVIPYLNDHITSQIKTLFRSRSGDMWLGGGSYIYQIDPMGKLKQGFGPENGLKVNDVRAFYEDEKGRIWIGTYGGGLMVVEGDNLIALSTKPNYMLGKDIFTLTKDQYGYLLMSSNNGLRMVHSDALNAFVEGKIDYLVPYFIGIQSGVFNTEFNGGFFNNHINKDGATIYFPSIQGIIFYLSRPIKAKQQQLQLSGVFADGKAILNPEEIARSTKVISFDFYDISFNEFDNVYYQYKLESSGASSSWSEPSKATSLQFDYLPPGNYTLILRTINGSNTPEPQTLRYSFRILPYFYERASFQVGSFFVLLVLTIGFYTRRYQKKQAFIQKERDMQYMVTELELRAIHSQMNPHLIFNSLNTLVQLIKTRSLEKAEYFTVAFGQLLRNILEKSGGDFIEISQEIKLLENYLNIQKIRFQDAVRYRIECDPALLNERIPAMLIQPLVENAIIHGLSHTFDGGEVLIRFVRKHHDLLITVEDDGVGRKQSATFREGMSHSSMGMTMVLKKIELIKSKYGIEISFDISDQREGPRPGTRAVIRISPVQIEEVHALAKTD